MRSSALTFVTLLAGAWSAQAGTPAKAAPAKAAKTTPPVPARAAPAPMGLDLSAPPTPPVPLKPVDEPKDPAPVVQAAPPPPPPPAEAPRAVATVGLKAGGIFPQVLGRLTTNFSVAVEGTWVTPLLDGRLALGAEVAYSQPSHQETLPDPRVPDSSYAYTITERTLAVFVGPRFYLLPPAGTLVPWVGAGVRAQFIDSQVVGVASAPFGRNDETGTHLAYAGQLGCGYRVGPGLLGLELQFVSAPLDHLVTGAVNVGDLAVRAAYLFTL